VIITGERKLPFFVFDVRRVVGFADRAFNQRENGR